MLQICNAEIFERTSTGNPVYQVCFKTVSTVIGILYVIMWYTNIKLLIFIDTEQPFCGSNDSRRVQEG